MRFQTGWQVFFYPTRRNVIGHLIQFGERLGALLRGEPWSGSPPHHVETVRVTEEGVWLYGASATEGFIPKPIEKRLGGLIPGRDFRIVSLPLSNREEEVSAALHAMHGTPYEKWADVLRVWRNGNRMRGADKVYCSEGSVRALAQVFLWCMCLDPDNTDPKEWLDACLRNGGRDVTTQWIEEIGHACHA